MYMDNVALFETPYLLTWFHRESNVELKDGHEMELHMRYAY